MNNQNPPEKWFLMMALVYLVFAAILGIAVYLTGATVGGVFIALLGSGGFIVLISKELVIRPKSIGFSDDGVVLFLPFGRRRTLQWHRITRVYVHDGDPNTMMGRIKRTGGIRECNKVTPIGLTYKLAMTVREEHFRRFGRYPPT